MAKDDELTTAVRNFVRHLQRFRDSETFVVDRMHVDQLKEAAGIVDDADG